MEKIEKGIALLKTPAQWPKWKWHMGLILTAHKLCNTVYGEKKCPTLTENPSTAETKEYENWVIEDAKASALIASGLSDEIAELVITSKTSHEVWQKLCSRFEQSSSQRMNSLIEKFYKAEKDPKEDISMHVARLQKLFMELNEELKKRKQNTLSETMLNGRILSTLGREYDNFRDLWDSFPEENQTLNTLIEKLCAIEMRETSESTSEERAAFVSKQKKQRKGMEKKDKKQRFPCKICKKLGHWAAECPEKTNGKKNAFVNCFSVYKNENLHKWICDSGASVHIFPEKEYFHDYKKFDPPMEINVGKKGVSMKAYGMGKMEVKHEVEKRWLTADIIDVWHVPEVIGPLFSVHAAAARKFNTIFTSSSVELRDQANNVVLEGKAEGSIYTLHMTPLKPKRESAMISSLQVYHERLAHQNKRYVKDFLKTRNIPFTDDTSELCDGCALGKMHRLPFKPRKNRASSVGEIIHSDVNGPMETTSLGGAKYYVCFKDDFSKYRRIFFLQRKNEVINALKDFLAEAENLGHSIKNFRCDGGLEFNNEAVKKVLAQKGIELNVTTPYSPEQNGAAERENRTTVEAARAMLITSKLPKKLWAEACNTSTYLLNRSGKSSVEGKVPYEVWHKKEIGSINHLKIFGTQCYVHIPKQFRGKFDKKAHLGYLVGYVNEKDGYRVYVPSKDNVVRSHDVKFKLEAVCNPQDYDQGEASTRNDTEKGVDIEEKTQELQDVEENSDVESDSSEVEENEQTTVRRTARMPKPNTMLRDYYMYSAFSAREPESYEEAIASEDSNAWQEAMNAELKALERNSTYEETHCPTEKRLFSTKWVYRIKTNSDGTPKYKARLVVRGCSQAAGIDYDETFSPVVKYSSLRYLFSLAARQNLKIDQMDVTTAYLQGDLKEDIYIKPPKGTRNVDKVWKLKKAMYGLKQGGRCWNEKLDKVLTNMGLTKSAADPCIYFQGKGNDTIIISVYVDDLLIFYSKDKQKDNIKRKLKESLDIKDLGKVKSILGMEVTCKSNEIELNQTEYIRNILKKFKMEESNAVSTPMEANLKLVRECECHRETLDEKVPYQEAVGSLLYLSQVSRPDIAYAVSVVSRFNNQPRACHWAAVKRIFRYLKGTVERKLVYKRNDNQDLKVYSDADWGNDPERRSTSGCCAKFSGALISWSSKRQKTVALSTTEAEYMALSVAVQEALWLRILLQELEPGYVKGPTTVYCDNMSAIKLSKNEVVSQRSKHIDIRYHFCKDHVRRGVIDVQYLPTDEMPADAFTKALPAPKHTSCAASFGLK